jgi:hypothetical protein
MVCMFQRVELEKALASVRVRQILALEAVSDLKGREFLWMPALFKSIWSQIS